MLTVFFLLVGLTGLTRLFELGISRRHRRLLFEQGAVAVTDPGFMAMVVLHVGVIVGSVAEVILVERQPIFGLSVAAAMGVILASSLRVWAIRSLGKHWNVQVVDSTNLGVVLSGPYRWVRHPNYVAVFAELSLLPLVHGAWITALVGTILHVVVLRRRIDLEEKVLMQDVNYRKHMSEKPRFVPSW